MTERYFEDFAVGQRFESGSYTLGVERLFEFAREYDPQPFHLDAEAASRSVFRGLAASGWHTAALTIKLRPRHCRRYRRPRDRDPRMAAAGPSGRYADGA
jgi:acyl dehydratase